MLETRKWLLEMQRPARQDSRGFRLRGVPVKRWTLVWVIGLTAALSGPAAAERQDSGDVFDPKRELGKALDQLAASQSYTFVSTSKTETESGGRQWGGGATPVPTKGKFHADNGVTGRRGDTKLARKGETVAFTDYQGNWAVAGAQRLIPAPSGAEGQPRTIRVFSGVGMQFQNFGAPHRSLNGILEKFQSIEPADETQTVGGFECVVFKAVLTEEGAKSILAQERSSRWGGSVRVVGGGAGGGRSTKYDGTATVWVDDTWSVRKVETVVTTSTDWNSRSYSTTRTSTTEFSAFNETEVRIPRAAEKAIEKAEKDKPKDE